MEAWGAGGEVGQRPERSAEGVRSAAGSPPAAVSAIHARALAR